MPASGTVPYQMFVVDPGWKEDKWVTAMEPRPGNPAVVRSIFDEFVELGNGLTAASSTWAVAARNFGFATMVTYMDASRSASVLTLVLAEPGCCGLISGLRCRAFALRP